MRGARTAPGFLTPEQAEAAIDALIERHQLTILTEEIGSLRYALTRTGGGLVTAFDREQHDEVSLIVRSPMEQYGVRLYLCQNGETIRGLDPAAASLIMGDRAEHVYRCGEVRFLDEQSVILVVFGIEDGRQYALTIFGQPVEVSLAGLLGPAT